MRVRAPTNGGLFFRLLVGAFDCVFHCRLATSFAKITTVARGAGAERTGSATGNGLEPPGERQLRLQKGPPNAGGPSLGRNAPRSKAPLELVT